MEIKIFIHVDNENDFLFPDNKYIQYFLFKNKGNWGKKCFRYFTCIAHSNIAVFIIAYIISY